MTNDTNPKAWRNHIVWTLGLYIAVAIITLSYGLAEYSMLNRIAPHFPQYTDEDTARMFGPLYGYDSDITQYAAHPLAVAINSTVDAMREDVETRVKDLLDDVYTVIEAVFLLLACVFAVFAVTRGKMPEPCLSQKPHSSGITRAAVYLIDLTD